MIPVTHQPLQASTPLLLFLICALLAIAILHALSFHHAIPPSTHNYNLTSITTHSFLPQNVTLSDVLTLLADDSQSPPPPPSYTASTAKRLIFYNRPPKTGSTTIRIAMKHALDAASMVSAKCFNRVEWNELALRTIINHRNVDFYGCHTRITPSIRATLTTLRSGNVLYMTSTRHPDGIILSAYMQEKFRDVRNLTEYEQTADIKAEVERYRTYVEAFPLDALYDYHGDLPAIGECPPSDYHEQEMRRAAARFEVVVDLARPEESAAMVRLVTGLPLPDFGRRENVRVRDVDSSPLLRALAGVNVSHRNCGNELVHRVLTQQFNIIKERLLRTRCFEEEVGNSTMCDGLRLSASETR